MFEYEDDLKSIIRSYPADQLEGLIRMGNTMERATIAMCRPEFLPALVHDVDWFVRYTCASSPVLGVAEQLVLAQDPSVPVRIKLARHAGAQAMLVMAEDPSWEVRRAVAFWGYEALLVDLVKDAEPIVRTAAVFNPLLPAHIRELVIKQDPDETVVKHALRAKAFMRRANEQEAEQDENQDH